MFDVVSVHPDKKYGYYVVTQKTLHHQIITVHRFNDVDYIELYDEKEPNKVVKVIHKEE